MAFDKEKVRQKIAFIGEKIGAEADPRLLNEYRLLFKKGFSFFRRSWAAAYLLMLYDQEQEARSGKDRGSFRSRPRGSPWEEKEKVPNRSEGSGKPDDGETAPRPFLPEEESRRLFISVGRNRHVFPREILGLIITRAQVGREDIGMIRILDSYSFVQVRDTVADRIIEALNGTVFRGRPMTANYARLKREEGSGEGPLETGSSAAPADTGVAAETPLSYADSFAGTPEPDENYSGDPEPEGDYPGDSKPDGDYPGDSEADGDYPGDSKQDDDQGDERGV